MTDAQLIASLEMIAKAVPETAETVLAAAQRIKEMSPRGASAQVKSISPMPVPMPIYKEWW